MVISSQIQDESEVLFLSRSDSGVARGAPVYEFCFAFSILLEHFLFKYLKLLFNGFFGFLCPSAHSKATEIHSIPQITGNTQGTPAIANPTPTPTKRETTLRRT